MTHQKLSVNPFQLIQAGQLLDRPVLLYGQWQTGADGGSAAQRKALLFFAPQRWYEVKSRSELQHLRSEIAATQQQAAGHVLSSGWAGYFSYEAGRAQQQIETGSAILAEFGYYPMVIHLDLERQEAVAHWHPDMDDEAVKHRLNDLLLATGEAVNGNTGRLRTWSQNWQPDDYQHAFQAVQDYLHAGDCYQVNLAMPFTCTDDLTSASPCGLFNAFDPAFGGYMNTPQVTLYSVSPERFMCIDRNDMETRPIKGTAPRGGTAQEDADNRNWLAQSEKNQAENLMIVDLLRNDMSLYAEPHSVRVEKLFDIETHANVHHMVSTINARLKSSQHAVDAVLAALPGGSITGAPKKRAMEIIDELEAFSRKAYCGSLGFFGDNGVADFNILIRTIQASADGAVCWGGGGIIVDSQCDDEWQEVLHKVQKILNTWL